MRMIILTLVSLLMMMGPCEAQEALVFSSIDSLLAEIGENILQEAYQRIGIQVDARVLPAERALVMANTGEVDGEVLRIKGIEKNYPNLRMVPVPLVVMEGMVLTKEVTFEVTGWESLKPYTIGIVRGVKFAENGTQGMTVEAVATHEQALLKLFHGRTDVVVMPRISGLVEIGKLHLTGITMLEPPLVTIDIYHYLHKKHEQLLPQITQVLQDMKAEGRFQEIEEHIIAEAIGQ